MWNSSSLTGGEAKIAASMMHLGELEKQIHIPQLNILLSQKTKVDAYSVLFAGIHNSVNHSFCFPQCNQVASVLEWSRNS